jgi:hypothetical protein
VQLSGKRRGTSDGSETVHCLITSTGGIIPTTDDRTKIGRLSCLPYPMPTRWPFSDIREFCIQPGLSLKPVEVLNHAINLWRYYAELPDTSHYIYNALWDIGTYFHHLFNSYPYDYKGGIKRSGKTKALTISSCIAFNAILTSDVTVSALFRLIHHAKATLLIDETEKLANPSESEAYRKIILAGYKRGAVVLRSEIVGDNWIPTSFDVYSPKRLANISGLHFVLEDRAISTNMVRSVDRKIADREVDPNDKRWSDLRCELYRLYLIYCRKVKESYDLLNKLSRDGRLIEFLKSRIEDIRERES